MDGFKPKQGIFRLHARRKHSEGGEGLECASQRVVKYYLEWLFKSFMLHDMDQPAAFLAEEEIPTGVPA